MASRVLVINAGSSSLKFKLFDLKPGELVPSVRGLLERIGDAGNSSVTVNVCVPLSKKCIVNKQKSCCPWSFQRIARYVVHSSATSTSEFYFLAIM
jgi:acetate kinase